MRLLDRERNQNQPLGPAKDNLLVNLVRNRYKQVYSIRTSLYFCIACVATPIFDKQYQFLDDLLNTLPDDINSLTLHLLSKTA